jgi:hypothetical protein
MRLGKVGQRTVHAMVALAAVALVVGLAALLTPSPKSCPHDVKIGDAIMITGCR